MGPFLQVSAGYPPVQGFDRFPFALLPEASAELSGFPCKGKGEAVFRKKEGWPVVKKPSLRGMSVGNDAAISPAKQMASPHRGQLH